MHAKADELEALGATHVGEFDEPAGHWITMLDPEGNEFCIHSPVRCQGDHRGQRLAPRTDRRRDRRQQRSVHQRQRLGRPSRPAVVGEERGGVGVAGAPQRGADRGDERGSAPAATVTSPARSSRLATGVDTTGTPAARYT